MLKRHVMGAVLMLAVAACGDQAPGAGSGETDAAEAAATGIGQVIASEAAGRPFPDDMPDFVEPMPGGSYLTGMTGSNAARSTGMVMYDAPGTAAEAIAFHSEALTKGGFSPQVGPAKPVRNTTETAIAGKHADGRTLDVIVIEKDGGDAVVQMNYTIPAG
jgi:hypothetical protein